MMPPVPSALITPLRLADLTAQLEDVISEAFAERYWVTAEIASLKVNAHSGHCYLDLADEGAQLRACLWRNQYGAVASRFAQATGSALQAGQQVLMQVSVRYHAQYGLSLTVHDVDPAYTLGEAMQRRQETFARLEREGWTQLNKARTLCTVPQRIAVISSATAEGFRDFRTLLQRNAAGYAFRIELFPALMQGQGAPASIAEAITTVSAQADRFDALVIIRGGGAQLDLACFDEFSLATQVAGCPLPVLTGIGHEVDISALDLVAHTRCAVPREVAYFLLMRAAAFEEEITTLQQELQHVVARRLEHAQHTLHQQTETLRYAVRQRLREADHQLERAHLRVAAADPEQLLRRGYSLTTANGTIVREAADVPPGQLLKTWLANGTLTSITVDETTENEWKNL
ncbi:exodeoxyribonuclease VII large subunit [Catalinimonas alkaloidigena]|uniref:Exodeoxyribonuclease 7 large subunit n=1 Tax=Catalinimonas alkaloidigena TaxID=1075417 RepID=A0A1G9LP54_9BACT|nr:exodeoxyribonuclease VII large subunit [Catalinimonas alkaloidigena]SDL63708.1 exodeoxyribonuclease VII large subunit [Catalinimonas alkaloidigena]